MKLASSSSWPRGVAIWKRRLNTSSRPARAASEGAAAQPYAPTAKSVTAWAHALWNRHCGCERIPGYMDFIDEHGFRANVGIIVTDGRGRVLIAGRRGRGGWQFPQGGIEPEESAEAALFRELRGASENDAEKKRVEKEIKAVQSRVIRMYNGQPTH